MPSLAILYQTIQVCSASHSLRLSRVPEIMDSRQVQPPSQPHQDQLGNQPAPGIPIHPRDWRLQFPEEGKVKVKVRVGQTVEQRRAEWSAENRPYSVECNEPIGLDA